MTLQYTDENGNHISLQIKQGNYFSNDNGQLILLLNQITLDSNYNFVSVKDVNFGITGEAFDNLIVNVKCADIPFTQFFDALQYVYLRAYAESNGITDYEIK